MSGAVSKRYARALYDLASEAGDVDGVAAGLEALSAAVAEVGPETLSPGNLSGEVRVKLGRALADGFGAESTLGRFLGVLADRDRLDEIPAIRDRFNALADDAAGRVRIAVTSAYELSDDDKTAIVERFEKIAGKSVVPELAVDETLIAGATVELEGRVYDGSVRTQLARLEARMAKGT